VKASSSMLCFVSPISAHKAGIGPHPSTYRNIPMSENYLDKKDFRPMVLPERGEQLEKGRQYVLTPLARLILQEKYGICGVPTIVECILIKTPPMRVEVLRTNLETNKSQYSIIESEGQEATFRVFMGVGRPSLKFEIDLLKLAEFAPFYADSHKLPALEADWFATRCLPSVHQKFRGCTLRWWSKGASTESSDFVPYKRAARKVPDLSLLD
jgi:hypothetical protein